MRFCVGQIQVHGFLIKYIHLKSITHQLRRMNEKITKENGQNVKESNQVEKENIKSLKERKNIIDLIFGKKRNPKEKG